MLTRDFERTLPQFGSHDEARAWFKEKFKDDFMMVESMKIDEQTLYRYHLITDREAYNKYQDKLEQSDGIMALSEEDMKGFMSYNTVEIFEDGDIHIVY